MKPHCFAGEIGHEVAIALNRHGWQIKALHRDPTKAAGRETTSGITWVNGDAMNATEMTNAAQGTSLIVHAVNPPGYRNWARLVVPMIDSSIRAARAAGALPKPWRNSSTANQHWEHSGDFTSQASGTPTADT
jgi:uncharacterized protein YbjT (DUF2867 family)